MRSRRSESGGTLLVFLLVLSGAVIVGALVVLSIAAMRSRAATAKVEAWQASLWAESGIDDGMNHLMHDPFYRADGTETFPLLQKEIPPDGRYEVKLTPLVAPDRFLFKATGFHKSNTSRMTQEARLRNPLLFSIIAEESIDLLIGAKVGGSVTAGENVSLVGASGIPGSVQTRGNFIGERDRVAGGVFEGVALPPWPLATYDPATVYPNPIRIPGGDITNHAVADTPLLITGAAEVTGLSVRNSTAIVLGSLRVRGNMEIEAPPGEIGLYVRGDLTVEEGGRLFVRGPVLVTGRFRNSGPARIQGTLLAKRVQVSEGFEIAPDLASAYTSARGLPSGIEPGRYREGGR